RQIAAAREEGMTATPSIRQKWAELETAEALDKTRSLLAAKGEYLNDNIPQLLGQMRWGQGAPYNNLCPGGSVTGCVATAFGMIMNYWDYPEHGFGMHSYNGADNPAAYPNWTYGVQYADFEHTYYDWEHMEDYAYINSSPEVKTAIATLLYHIGVSLDMHYTPNGSGCWSLPEYALFDTSLHLAPIAYTMGADYRIPRHFGYKYSYSGLRDSVGNDSLWLTMLYNSLAEGKPIYYAGWAAADNEAGHSGTSGHGYIIDGYFSDAFDTNFFHINWGWSGSSDGFFKLDAMRPSNNDFTRWHGAIIGLEPDTSYHGYDYTGIKPVLTYGFKVKGMQGFISFSNVHDQPIFVYDLEGRLVTYRASSPASEWNIGVRPGLYIVRVGWAPVQKVFVY
ncbi:MAG: C10 family peptidase, partial [Bacteroidales bacterium]|nr:C10 family peptidase [Bacteroidales bacterium]